MSMLLRLCRRTPTVLAGYARRGFNPETLSGGEQVDPAMLAQANLTRTWLADPIASAALTPDARKQYEDYIAQLESAAKGAGRQSAKAPKQADVLDLGKSWHVLHFVMTGTAAEAPLPEGLLLSGGREVGEDLGYGAARVVTAEQTAACAAHLAGLAIDAEAGRIDGETMRRLGVYGAEQEASELAEEIRDGLLRLRDYLAKAVSQGEGLVIWMD